MRLINILVTVILVFIPLYPKFPLQSVEGTYVSIRVEDLVIASCLIFWLWLQIKNKFPILKDRFFKLFLLYWLAGLMANIFAFGVTDLISFKLAMLHWARRVEYMVLFLLVKDAIVKKKDFVEVLLVPWIALLLVFAYGLGQKYLGLPVISTMNEEFSKGLLLQLDKWTRISATFAGHYDLAAWLAILLSLSPSLIVFFRRIWQKALVVFASLAGFYLLILTASRVSFFSYLIGITLTLAFLRRYRWIFPVLLISLFFGFQSKELNARLIASVKTLPVVGEMISGRIAKRVTPIPTIELVATPTPTTLVVPIIGIVPPPKPVKVIKEARTWPTVEEAEVAAARSSRIRFEVEWPRAIRAFLKNSLLGTGYSSLGLATDNDYLRILGETGILGLMSFFLIIFSLLKESLTSIVNKNGAWSLSAATIGVLAAFMSNAIFIDVFEASKVAFYFWILMGILSKNSNFQFSNSK